MTTITTHKTINVSCLSNNILHNSSILQANSLHKQNIKKKTKVVPIKSIDDHSVSSWKAEKQ